MKKEHDIEGDKESRNTFLCSPRRCRGTQLGGLGGRTRDVGRRRGNHVAGGQGVSSCIERKYRRHPRKSRMRRRREEKETNVRRRERWGYDKECKPSTKKESPTGWGGGKGRRMQRGGMLSTIKGSSLTERGLMGKKIKAAIGR